MRYAIIVNIVFIVILVIVILCILVCNILYGVFVAFDIIDPTGVGQFCYV